MYAANYHNNNHSDQNRPYHKVNGWGRDGHSSGLEITLLI